MTYTIYLRYLNTATKLDNIPKITATNISAPKNPKIKIKGTGNIGIPLRKDAKKGVEYQRRLLAIPHPNIAPTDP